MAEIPIGANEEDAVPTYRGSEVGASDENDPIPKDEWRSHVGWSYLEADKGFTGLPRPFAGVDGSFSTEGGVKEKKSLIDKMKKLVPFKYNNEGKRVKITPLTQMYLVRYLAPLLYMNAEQALLKQKVTPEKKSSSKKEATKRLQQLIRQVDEMDDKLAGQSTLEMDVLFPFQRLKTLLSNSTDEGPEFKHGMIQQYYSTLNAAQKKRFKEFLVKLPNGLPTNRNNSSLMIEERYHQGLLAMYEELQDSGKKATKLSLLDDPSGEKRLPVEQGSVLTSFGVNILLAESSGRHGLAETLLTDYPIEWEELEDLDGVGYLLELIVAVYDLNNSDAIYELQSLMTTEFTVVMMNLGTKGEPATAVVMEDENEVRIGFNLLSTGGREKAHNSIAQEGSEKSGSLLNLEGESVPKGPRVPGCIVMFRLAEHLYKVMRLKKLKYSTGVEVEFTDEERQYRTDAFNEVFATTIEEGKLTGINGSGTFNPGNILFDNDTVGYCTIVSASGSEESAIDPNEARLFNAVGQVLETIMLDNAVTAAKGTKNFPSHTRYDETINALIGNTNAIGIATYHAQFHFNYLLNQLQSPFKSMNVQGEQIIGGRLLAIEAYFGDPTKLMLYWMLNFRDYLDWGGTADDGTPLFFQAPLDNQTKAEIGAYEKNKLAHLILSYYRLSFAMLATKEVITTKGKKPKGAADIKEYWTKLLSDANTDPPPGSRFVQMLAYAFGGVGDETRRKDIPYAAWLPPPTQTAAMTTKQDSANLISKYLKWAYGQKPLDITWFGEVAAVYHAAKAISMSDDYASLVEGFVEAVAADGGHAFLFAILLNENSERNSIPETPAPIQVEIVGGAYIGTLKKGGGDPPAPIIGGGDEPKGDEPEGDEPESDEPKGDEPEGDETIDDETERTIDDLGLISLDGDDDPDLSVFGPKEEPPNPGLVEFAKDFINLANLGEGEDPESRNKNINTLLNDPPKGVDEAIIELFKTTIVDASFEEAVSLAEDLIPEEDTTDLSDLLGDGL